MFHTKTAIAVLDDLHLRLNSQTVLYADPPCDDLFFFWSSPKIQPKPVVPKSEDLFFGHHLKLRNLTYLDRELGHICVSDEFGLLFKKIKNHCSTPIEDGLLATVTPAQTNARGRKPVASSGGFRGGNGGDASPPPA